MLQGLLNPYLAELVDCRFIIAMWCGNGTFLLIQLLLIADVAVKDRSNNKRLWYITDTVYYQSHERRQADQGKQVQGMSWAAIHE